MQIDKLILNNFRNYVKKDFVFEQRNVIVGGNGIGKTNILEAIYMLATGKSFRAETDNELIRYNEEYANILGEMSFWIDKKQEINKLRIFISERKRFEVNQIARRQVDFVGKLRAVLFTPSDIEIITGSPSKRRKYLDFVLSQKDREYRRSLLSYEKGLRHRNKLLDLIAEGKASRQQLWFWDKLIIKEGNFLTETREKFVYSFNSFSGTFSEINNDTNTFFQMVYDKSEISEKRLQQYEKEEVLAGSTLVGPHRDDFVINVNLGTNEFRDLSKFGSRGQQRMAILALKMFELKFLTNILEESTNKQETPVLLLDDIFSELDHEHRDEVMRIVEKHKAIGGQVIMTTADNHLLPEQWNNIYLTYMGV